MNIKSKEDASKINIKFSLLGKVTDVFVTKETITFVFGEKKKIMEIIAYADCCSYSWFEYPADLKKIIGSHIINIIDSDKYIELPPSNIQEHDENNVCYIFVKNRKTPYIFYLRNSSNGYYSGWLEIELRDNEHVT